MDALDQYLARLQADIHDVLLDEIAEGAKDVMQNAVSDMVYDAYRPIVYSRRGNNGGLGDKNNMSVTSIQDGIALTNEAAVNTAYGVSRFANGKSLAEIVCNGGNNYMYGDESYSYYAPRDFITLTQNRLDDGIAEQIATAALRKKGYRFE